MTITEAIDYINAHTWSQWKLGLSRTEELLRLLGAPQKELRFVHVAGSNGKGSTCAMTEAAVNERKSPMNLRCPARRSTTANGRKSIKAKIKATLPDICTNGNVSAANGEDASHRIHDARA